MSRLELATPERRTRRYEKARHGQRIHMRRTLRRSLRSGGDPIRLARRRRRVVRRRLVMLCDISGLDGALRPRLPPVPGLRGRGRPEGGGVRLRHAVDPPDSRAGLSAPGAGDPARRARGAGLVERHPDRRRAQGVQRSPRPARHGSRSRGRHPLRRLGARRPRARGPGDGAAGAPGPPNRLGQPSRQRQRLLGAGRRHGGRARALRRARERS